MAYPYENDFQRCLLAALWSDDKFAARHGHLIKPDYFTDEILAGVAECLLRFREREGSLPSREALAEELRASVAPGRSYREYVTEAGEVHNRIGTNPEYFQSKAIDFARKHAIARAVEEAYECLETGDVDRIETLVQGACRIGADANTTFYDYFAEARARTRRYIGKGDSPNGALRVPTGVGPIDRAIQGGLGPGELGVIMALPKHGKSTLMVSMGVAALMSGRSVLHVSLENSKDLVAARYDTRIFGESMEDIKRTPKSFHDTLLDLAGKLTARLLITFAPTKSLTVSALAALISGSGAPGLVIVDYADLMRSHAKREDKRFELADIYEGLRRVAGELNVPIWTGSQANRPAFGQSTLGMEHLAECFEKAAIMDVGVSIAHGEEAKRRGEMRLHLMGNRLGPSGFEVGCSVDWKTGVIKTDLEEVEGEES